MPDGASRELHPGAWWTWALLLAAAAAATTNVLVLAFVASAACVVVVNRRTSAPWALAFRQYLWVAAFILVLRVVFRLVFSGGDELAAAAMAGFADGLRLAVLVVCVGAANALASPKRLLASLPAALHEAGTAVVIALSVFPQLAESAVRIRRARELRGDRGRWRSLHALLVPVLEDAFDRSLALASSMDARGYGRSGTTTRAARRTTSALLVAGLAGICIGMYAVLDTTTPRALGIPMLLLGVVVAAIGIRASGRRVLRTRLRRDPWRAGEYLVASCGLGAAIAMFLAARVDPAAMHPDVGLLALPPVPILALVGVAIAALPAAHVARPVEVTA